MVGMTASVNATLLLSKPKRPGYYTILEYYDLNDLNYIINQLKNRGISVTENTLVDVFPVRQAD